MKPEIVSYNVGDIVWFRSGGEHRGIVTAVMSRRLSKVYVVRWEYDLEERDHDAIELCTEKPKDLS